MEPDDKFANEKVIVFVRTSRDVTRGYYACFVDLICEMVYFVEQLHVWESTEAEWCDWVHSLVFKDENDDWAENE